MRHLYDTTCELCDVTHKPSPETPCLCLLCSGCERPYPPALASYDYPGQECISCMDLGRAGAPLEEFPAERERAGRER